MTSTNCDRREVLAHGRTAADRTREELFASKAGAPTNPAWFHNLVASPDATVEVGTETVAVRAEVLTGDERDRLYRRQAEKVAAFAEYQEKTTRVIPVVALTRAG
jgi:deazaflavin-dependent oxidoreductase (nitroreductase family)